MVKAVQLADHELLFLDCQTTAATPQQGSLLEIAWFTASAGGNRTALQSSLLAQPQDKPVPRRIQLLTGIDDSSMAQALPPSTVRELLERSISSLAEPRICIAHYARFELPFLADLFNGARASTSRTLGLPFELLCTYEIARRLFPNLPSKGIRAIAGYFGTTCGELKRAQSHAEATYAIWQGLTPVLDQLGLTTPGAVGAWLNNTPKPKRTKFEYPLAREKRLELPDQPGVYRMLSKSKSILYVGKATSLRQRVNSYFRGQLGKDSKTKELLSQVFDIVVTTCGSPLEAALLETDEIKRWDPPYNRALKRGNRKLIFYSSDFSRCAQCQSLEHPIGPFVSESVLEPLIKLSHSLQTNRYQSDIFFQPLPELILREGFALFCINEGLERASMNGARSLIALGLWLYRKERRKKRADDGKSDAALESPVSAVLRDTITPALVEDKFARLLRRIAHAYLRAKSLTALLQAEVHVTHRSEKSHFFVSRGKIDSSRVQSQLQTSPIPWLDLDLDTYDRMSVLLAELDRESRRQTVLENSDL